MLSLTELLSSIPNLPNIDFNEAFFKVIILGLTLLGVTYIGLRIASNILQIKD